MSPYRSAFSTPHLVLVVIRLLFPIVVVIHFLLPVDVAFICFLHPLLLLVVF